MAKVMGCTPVIRSQKTVVPISFIFSLALLTNVLWWRGPHCREGRISSANRQQQAETLCLTADKEANPTKKITEWAWEQTLLTAEKERWPLPIDSNELRHSV